jgi:hypothetical protein
VEKFQMARLVLEKKKILKLVLFLHEIQFSGKEYCWYIKHQMKKETHILFLVQETANNAH